MTITEVFFSILNRGLIRIHTAAKEIQKSLVTTQVLRYFGRARFFKTFLDSIYQSGLENATQKPLQRK